VFAIDETETIQQHYTQNTERNASMHDTVKYLFHGMPKNTSPSLALPDPLRAGAYRLEIISAALRGSGTVYRSKKYLNQQFLLGVNKVTCIFKRSMNLFSG